MKYLTFRKSLRALVFLAGLTIVLAAPVAADWLVTVDGRLIETRDAWTIDGETLSYIGIDGEEISVALDDVDLEASEETTAVKQGRRYEPRVRAVASDPEPAEPPPAAAANGEPRVILYQTSWCGYCRKANKLLKDLDVDFVSKDIEKNKEAAREYQKKGQGYRGIPLIDIDGEMIRGYNEGGIRKLVQDMRQRQEEGAD